MIATDDRLLTPIFIKTDEDMPLPEGIPAYYVLSASGLFLCRSHPLFSSCVRAPVWPTELAAHEQRASLRYPEIPKEALECVVGFFAAIFEQHGAEAVAVLVWDRAAARLEVRVPTQCATVSVGSTGRRYPLDVHYDPIDDAGPDLSPIGTIHSHGDGAAYASHTDKEDEAHRAGLHVVVGRIGEEPPEFHCEFVVDSTRFHVDARAIAGHYERRARDFPADWMDRVTVEPQVNSASIDSGPWGGASTWEPY